MSTSPDSTSRIAFSGWWSLIETPKKRIFPSRFSRSIASSQSPWPDPLVGPDVELLDVDRLETEVPQAALGTGDDPVGREDLLWAQAAPGRPFHVLRRDLAGDVDRLCRLAHGGADELLAVAVAVRVGGVEEVDAVLDRTPESPHGFVVVGSDPPRPADSPGPEAELGDLEARLAQRPVAHRRLLAQRIVRQLNVGS